MVRVHWGSSIALTMSERHDPNIVSHMPLYQKNHQVVVSHLLPDKDTERFPPPTPRKAVPLAFVRSYIALRQSETRVIVPRLGLCKVAAP